MTVGLTGREAQPAAAAKQYRVYDQSTPAQGGVETADAIRPCIAARS